MTVAELITELQKYPANAVVLKESFLGTFYASLPENPTELISVMPTIAKSCGMERIVYFRIIQGGISAVFIK